MRKVGRTRFQIVRLKGKQCAMTGALFSEKRTRGNFSAPFAQWRSPNASLSHVPPKLSIPIPDFAVQ